MVDLFGEVEAPAENPIITTDLPTSESHLTATLQPPRLMDTCLGHEHVEREIIEQFENGRMPHGLIFTGQKGIGKATMAYRLARFLLKQQSTDPNQDALFGAEETPSIQTDFNLPSDDPIFRQVASGGHPDLLTVEREYDSTKDKYKAQLAVDEVRKINPFLRMTASKDDGWRVVIVDDADTMNRNAQNAILKVLEEPPPRTCLILVCHRLGAMIPTIRSRAHTVSFKSLSIEHFTKLLSVHENSQNTTLDQNLYDLAEGSVGKAIQYIEQDGLETLEEIITQFNDYPNWSWPKIHKLGDQMAKTGRDQAYSNFAFLLPWVFSEMIKRKARGQELTIPALQTNALQQLYQQSSLETLLKICENLKEHFDRIERANLDKRQGVFGAFTIIAE